MWTGFIQLRMGTVGKCFRKRQWALGFRKMMGSFLIIKSTRCTNFPNLFWKWNSTCFGQFLCPSSGVFHCTYSNGVRHTCLLTACKQNQDGTALPSWSCSQVVYKPVWHIPLLSVRWITPDDGQRNCPKNIEFHFQNKFEKLVQLVGFIIRKFVTKHGHMNANWRTVSLLAEERFSFTRWTLFRGVGFWGCKLVPCGSHRTPKGEYFERRSELTDCNEDLKFLNIRIPSRSTKRTLLYEVMYFRSNLVWIQTEVKLGYKFHFFSSLANQITLYYDCSVADKHKSKELKF